MFDDGSLMVPDKILSHHEEPMSCAMLVIQRQEHVYHMVQLGGSGSRMEHDADLHVLRWKDPKQMIAYGLKLTHIAE